MRPVTMGTIAPMLFAIKFSHPEYDPEYSPPILGVIAKDRVSSGPMKASPIESRMIARTGELTNAPTRMNIPERKNEIESGRAWALNRVAPCFIALSMKYPDSMHDISSRAQGNDAASVSELFAKCL